MRHINGEFHPELGSRIWNAVQDEVAKTIMGDDDTRTVHGLHDRSVCELSDGSILPPATVRRLACDADIIPIVLGGDGQPLDVGRSKRFATSAQRKALRAMHDTCAFPGCDVAFDDCEIHHLLDWDHMGPTDLANLKPVCNRHHHVLHEGGWHAKVATDGTLQVWPPGETPPDDAIPQAKNSPPGRQSSSGPPGREPMTSPSSHEPGQLFDHAS